MNATVENAQGSSTPGCEPDCFIPATVTIDVGGMVTFANNDSAAHTSTSGSPGNPDGVWDSSLVMMNSAYTTPALDAGEYPYYCAVHPWMTGLVIVKEEFEQVSPSENGTLDIGLSVIPQSEVNSVSKLHIGWLESGLNKIQEHIDYRITVIKDDQNIFGPIPLTHTSVGTVKIPIEFTSNGEHQVKIEMEGILFQPIPLETTYFTINVATNLNEEMQTETQSESTTTTTTSSSNIVENAQGSSTPGCEPDCFIPATLNIAVGGMVTFANNDSAAHTSTAGTPADGPSGAWDSSLVMMNSAYTTPALDAGEYPYYCAVHPWMTGVVIVGNVVAYVADTIPPQVLVPDDIVIETDNQNGVSATFNPQAIDNVDEIISPTCNFSSGSVFPIGTTEIICTATDSAGNYSSNSFNVIIEFSGILIPEWIKNVAGFWNTGDINDESFLEGITYLIQNNIIVVPSSDSSVESSSTVPTWVKNTAGWWATNQIDDETFVNAIQFLIQAGLIQV